MLFPVVNCLLIFLATCEWFPATTWQTGTRPGVGTGKNRYMAVGNILECGITNLGAQRHEIIA
jgi:5-carboxymethyl-2-hydroxymuconate isomerase